MKFILPFFVRPRHLKFRTKLIISYIILITIPLGIMGYKYYSTSLAVLSEFARENIHSVVKQNNQIIDAELSKAEESSLAMIADQDLFYEYQNAKQDDEYSMINMEKKITKIFNKYFSEYKNIYSVHLVTSYFNFGTATLIPYQNFRQTDLYREAIRADGGLQWIPTYDFTEMFDQDYLKTANIDYRHLFSAVRQIKVFHIDNGIVTTPDRSVELPILVVNYEPDLYKKRFESSLPFKGSFFFVADKQGDIIAHSDQSKLTSNDTTVWLNEITEKRSGSSFVEIDGKKMIVCYDTSQVTGWISAVVISPEELMGSFIPEIKSYTFYIAIALVAISLIFAFLISGSITKPIRKLLQAIKKMGEGDFDNKIPVSDKSEMGYLINKFNHMNGKIDLLIEENYKVKIREKEAEIMALNIQLNPHFLYNTLNIINWMAIENKQKEISKMIIILSAMLQYTSQNHHDMGDFRADLEWLQNYIYIIDNRFEGKFTVHYDIEPELLDERVPKLFLQPFVENSIIHGFADMESGGQIHIIGWSEGDNRYFSVEDNGKGISDEKITDTMHNERKSIGIQNVDKRIKLIYGDNYGVSIKSQSYEGTIVMIVLPRINK